MFRLGETKIKRVIETKRRKGTTPFWIPSDLEPVPNTVLQPATGHHIPRGFSSSPESISKWLCRPRETNLKKVAEVPPRLNVRPSLPQRASSQVAWYHLECGAIPVAKPQRISLYKAISLAPGNNFQYLCGTWVDPHSYLVVPNTFAEHALGHISTSQSPTALQSLSGSVFDFWNSSVPIIPSTSVHYARRGHEPEGEDALDDVKSEQYKNVINKGSEAVGGRTFLWRWTSEKFHPLFFCSS